MALLKSVGTSFCPNYMDWFGIESSESPSRNADRSVASKFLQTRPADFSTTKLQVWFSFATYFLKTERNWEGKTGNFLVQSHQLYWPLLQEMVRLMREKRYPAAFKCYHNFHKVDSTTNDSLHFKMVIHVHSDSAFRRYQKEMRYHALNLSKLSILAVNLLCLYSFLYNYFQ